MCIRYFLLTLGHHGCTVAIRIYLPVEKIDRLKRADAERHRARRRDRHRCDEMNKEISSQLWLISDWIYLCYSILQFRIYIDFTAIRGPDKRNVACDAANAIDRTFQQERIAKRFVPMLVSHDSSWSYRLG